MLSLLAFTESLLFSYAIFLYQIFLIILIRGDMLALGHPAHAQFLLSACYKSFDSWSQLEKALELIF